MSTNSDGNPRRSPPDAPKIYHIIHADNLPSLIEHGCLWSDAEMLRRGILCTTIGMSEIKSRRLNELVVECYPTTKVGDYVPFYFCPRSVMLYVLHQGNARGLNYHGGQTPIIHLESDLYRTIQWAQNASRRWAFTRSNAGAFYTRFYTSVAELNLVNWQAVEATQWKGLTDGKQAEFLLHENFPWSLVERIGVIDRTIEAKVKSHIQKSSHIPPVEILRDWYY